MDFRRFFALSLGAHLLVLAIYQLSFNPADPTISARKGLAFQLSGPAISAAPAKAAANRNSGRQSIRKYASQIGEHSAQQSAQPTAGVISRKISPTAWGIVYPEMARAMGKQGRVIVRCLLAAQSQHCREVQVARSSGYAELDRAALAGVRRYNKFTLSNRIRNFELSVHFRLVD